MSRLLHDAAIKGEYATIDALLNQGVSVDEVDAYGETSLLYAADNGHLDVVRLLLDHGADINYQTLGSRQL